MERIKRLSADTETMVGELLKRLNHPNRTTTALLLGKAHTEAAKMSLAVRVLALAGVPARMVHGVALKDQKERVPLVHWLEVFDKKKWQAIDPVTGAPGIPDNYLAWWRGPGPLARLTGGSDLTSTSRLPGNWKPPSTPQWSADKSSSPC